MEGEAGGGDHGGERAEEAHEREDLDRQQPGVDAGELGRVGVAAGGEDVAAEAGPAGDDRHHHRDDDQEEHRDRQAEALGEALGHHLAAGFEHLAQAVRGHLVGVQDGDEAEDGGGADRAERISAQTGFTGKPCLSLLRRAAAIA
jgi:hypothetical protein